MIEYYHSIVVMYSVVSFFDPVAKKRKLKEKVVICCEGMIPLRDIRPSTDLVMM